MRRDGLARLHASMQAIDLTRAKFQVRHNHLTFTGLFLTDVTPYELALACFGHDFVLIFDVTGNYKISDLCARSMRPCRTSSAPASGPHRPTWSMRFVIMAELTCNMVGTTSTQRQYYISSLSADIVRIGRIVRSRCYIENHVH